MNNGKLVLISCFICGKDLKCNVIQEHIEQCLPNSNYQELPVEYKDLFKKLSDGVELSEEEINELNAKADKLFKEVSLIPCPNCGRKFYPDRVQVHMKNCKGECKKKNGATTSSTTTSTTISSINKQTNINNDSQRIFLEKLEKELQNEEKDKDKDINQSTSASASTVSASSNKPNTIASKVNNASTEKGNNNKLRGSVKTNNKKQTQTGDESNKIFLEKLEKELQTQDNHYTNLSSTMKKKKEEPTENSNKIFLEKLNKELKNEHEPEITEIETMKVNKSSSLNKPLKLSNVRSTNLYEKKKAKNAYSKETKEIDSKQKFMELLDKELSKESEMNKVVEPNKTIKQSIDDSNKLFLEKLEKEIQKDSEGVQPIALIEGSKANITLIEDKPKSNTIQEKKVKAKADKVAPVQQQHQIKQSSSSTQDKDKKNQSAQYLAQHQPAAKKTQLKVSNILCYICGKDYGSSSLPIHLRTCEVNWKKEHPNIDMTTEKPKVLDNLLSQLKEQTLTQNTIDSYIKQAEKAFRILNYLPCPNCGQKFLTERLNVHLKGCHAQAISSTKLFEEKVAKQLEPNKQINIEKEDKAIPITNNEEVKENDNDNEKNKEEPQEQPLKETPSRPLLLICYICGNEFDRQTLEGHLESCMKLHSEIHTILPRELEKIFAKIESEEEERITNEEIIAYNNVAKEQVKVNVNYLKKEKIEDDVKEDKKSLLEGREEENDIKDGQQSEEERDKQGEDEVMNDDDIVEYKSDPIEKESNDKDKDNEEEDNSCSIDNKFLACYKCGRHFIAETIEAHMRICKGN